MAKHITSFIAEPGKQEVVIAREFEGLPEKGHVSLEVSTLDVMAGGRTRLTVMAIFQSVADRDGMIASDMNEESMNPMTVWIN